MDYREEFSSLFLKQEEHTLRGTFQNWASRVPPFKVTEGDTDDFLLRVIHSYYWPISYSVRDKGWFSSKNANFSFSPYLMPSLRVSPSGF